MHGPKMGAAFHGSAKHARAMQAAEHGNGNGKGRNVVRGNSKARPAQAMNGKAPAAHGRPEVARSAKGPDKTAGRGNGNIPAVAAAGKAMSGVKLLEDGRHYYAERGARPSFDFASVRRGLIDGCPPGLAKKNNGCQPPGLARQRSYQPSWWGYSNLAGGPYYYDDGYLLRLNGGSVASYLPLLGGALSVGNIWPSYYQPMPVPEYYTDYYGLGPAGSYRYADNVLYDVDPSTSAISSIAALLTGDTFNIGSPLPSGYDVYNVPYGYRSQYADGPDAWYRYSDGYIYQVDPTTRLVQAAIDLLAG
jgi:hypothetical protein